MNNDIDNYDLLVTIILRVYYGKSQRYLLKDICEDFSSRYTLKSKKIDPEVLQKKCLDIIENVNTLTFNLDINRFKAFVLPSKKDDMLINYLNNVRDNLELFYKYIGENENICRIVVSLR